MYDGVDVSQVQMNPSSYSDQKARMFVKENFPKSVVIDDSQKVGNTGPNADTVGVDNNFEDEESRKVLHESFPYGVLPKSSSFKEVTAQHAFISLKQLVAAVITMVVTTAALHNHFYWFLCLDPEAAEYVPVENLFIFGIFTDGFPLFKGIAATLSCLVLANLPAMLQMPDFHFLNFFV